MGLYSVCFVIFLPHLWSQILGHVQNSGYSFCPFVDIDTPTHYVVFRLSMLFLAKYIYCSKITKVIDVLFFQIPVTKDAFGTEI